MSVRSISIRRCCVSEENKATVRRIYEAIWNQQNLAFIADHFASDFLGHSTTEIQGPDGLLQRAGPLFAALHDGEFTIQDQIAEGDKVVTRWIASGVPAGVYEDGTAPDNSVTIIGVDIFRIAHSKIIEGWMVAEIKEGGSDG